MFSTTVVGTAVGLLTASGVAVGALLWVAVGLGVRVAVAWLVGRAVPVACGSTVGPTVLVPPGAVLVGTAGVFSVVLDICGVWFVGTGAG